MKILNSKRFISERIKVKSVTNAELSNLTKKHGHCIYNYHPNTEREFRDIIYKKIKKEGNACDLNDIYTGNITDMSYLFSSVNKNGFSRIYFDDFSNFCGDISKWDVSNVTNMEGMFYKNKVFNCDLMDWDVSNVKDMSWMFSYAESFNGNISGWMVDNVENMRGMFCKAVSFKGILSDWHVSKVIDMNAMFDSAESFNCNISGWTVSSVTDMRNMFKDAKCFIQDLSGWDVKNVEFAFDIFHGTPMRYDTDKHPKFNDSAAGIL